MTLQTHPTFGCVAFRMALQTNATCDRAIFRMALQTNPTCDRAIFSEWPCQRTLHVTVWFSESSDEGISMGDSTSDGSKDLPAVEDLHRELVELRQQLERERLLRMMMEERSRDLETQLVNQPRHPHLSSHLPSPINLKVVSTCAG